MDLILKDRILNDFRKQLVTQLLDFLRGKEDLKDCIYTPKQLTEEKNSPEIALRKGTENEYFIYYPRFSAPYVHRLDGVIKRCEVIMGQIYEAKCGRTFTSDDGEFIIPADQDYEPYTLDNICIALIKLEKAPKP